MRADLLVVLAVSKSNNGENDREKTGRESMYTGKILFSTLLCFFLY
jgi:hypothetical protein